MQKLLFLTAILIVYFPAGNLLAQTKSFELGVTGGAGATWMHGNSIINRFIDPAINLSGGLSAQLHLGERFSLLSGIGYENKGGISKGAAFNQNGEYIGDFRVLYRLNYVTMPLLFRITFGGSNLKYFINAGAYAGYNTDAYQKYSIAGNRNGQVHRDLNLINWDAGAVLGAGLQIPISDKISASVEIRNSLGLLNISSVPVVDNKAIRTNALSLLSGLSYKL